MKKSSRYLIVEDNDDHSALIERNLRRVAPESFVERLVDGVQALQYLRGDDPYGDRELPDVVLLDLKLPRASGLQVLKEVKGDDRLSAIPIIMLTTSAAERDRLIAYRHHVNSYLLKPMDFVGFRKLVSDICHYWGDLNCPVRGVR